MANQVPACEQTAVEQIYLENQEPAATELTTEQLGWPDCKLRLYTKWYFKVEDVLQEIGIRSLVEKNGFKPYIDKLLAEQGKWLCLFI